MQNAYIFFFYTTTMYLKKYLLYNVLEKSNLRLVKLFLSTLIICFYVEPSQIRFRRFLPILLSVSNLRTTGWKRLLFSPTRRVLNFSSNPLSATYSSSCNARLQRILSRRIQIVIAPAVILDGIVTILRGCMTGEKEVIFERKEHPVHWRCMTGVTRVSWYLCE